MQGLTTTPLHGASPASRAHIDVLVLDDDPGVCRLFSRILHRAGCTVLCVESASAFVEAYISSTPAVIIVDVILGRHDCCSVLDFLASRRSTVPIILMSGYDHRFLSLAERTAKGSGLVVAGLLEKRHEPERIVDLVKRHRVVSC